MEDNKSTLAMELIHDARKTATKWKIATVAAAALLLATNIAWYIFTK